eukprot:6136969-Pyramimonas_sp.AAC.1
MSPNLRCLTEDSVVPGLTKAVVADYLEKLYGENGDIIVSGEIAGIPVLGLTIVRTKALDILHHAVRGVDKTRTVKARTVAGVDSM